MKNFQILASLIGARLNCIKSGNAEWKAKHEAKIENIVREEFPRGSGYDNGTSLDLDASTEEKLVLHTAYHHMDENGYYDGWTEHVVTVKPSLCHGFIFTISGRDKAGIKEYLGECFHLALDKEEDKEVQALDRSVLEVAQA